MILKYVVTDNRYIKLRDVLKKHFDMSQRLLGKLKLNKKITINGKYTFLDKELNIADIIEINIDFDDDTGNVVPTEMKLDIVYEDDSMLVISKPPQMAIHPSSNHYDTSLSNGVRYYYNLKGIKSKIHLVNRLDKDTSGLVIFAKNEYIQECLIKQMKNNRFYKEYIAILVGKLDTLSGTINAPISRKNGSIIEREVNVSGEKAVTHYEVLKYLDTNDISLVKFVLETGRTHQIRVHSKNIGHPILGDTLYGEQSDLIQRQALHSYITSFIHPITMKKVEFTAQIPTDMNNVICNYNK